SPTDGSARLLADSSSDRLRFVPAANDNGPATFAFRAWDQTSGADGGTADASGNGGITAFSSAAGTATITVNAVNDVPTAANDGPVANADSATTREDTPVNVTVLSNDTDVDGDSLSVAIYTQGAHGAVTPNADGTLRYAPAANYFGPDSFTYTASDGHLLSNAA